MLNEELPLLFGLIGSVVRARELLEYPNYVQTMLSAGVQGLYLP